MNASAPDDLLRLREYLAGTGIRAEILSEAASTNDIARTFARRGERGLCVVADRQTAGRGRNGRSFYSPSGTGLYLSAVVGTAREKPCPVTAAAAVAVSEAIDELSNRASRIKWVNDVLLGGKKVCGILSEGGIDENGEPFVVVGVGVNVFSPPDGFPPELEGIAGAVFPTRREIDRGRAGIADARARLAASLLAGLYEYCANGGFMDEYRRRSCVLGRRIDIIMPDGAKKSAEAVSIDDSGALNVISDGVATALVSGEISIRTGI